VNARGLLERHGSPLYVYDVVSIRSAHAMLRRAIPDESILFYSVKANPNVAVARELARLGCDAEVSSSGEVMTAIDAGFSAAGALYNGPGKSFDEILFALRKGIVQFSVDSALELGKVARAAAEIGVRAKVLLRINADRAAPGVALTMTGTPSQFGIDASHVREHPEQFASCSSAQVVGFQCYMGSNLTTVDGLLNAFDVAVDVSAELARRLMIEPELVDLGGGFGHAYATGGEQLDFSALRSPLERLLDASLRQWRQGQPRIAFESGRYLVARAGSLLCTVEDVKVSRGKPFVVLDTGTNHLGGMSGLRRVPNLGATVVLAAPAPAAEPVVAPRREGNIVGPLCTPLDHLARDVVIPPVSPGDILRIPNVGAYGLTASLIAFLSRELPAEVVVEDDVVLEVSKLALTRQVTVLEKAGIDG
jgi:diaminopimelate decarboxylase